MLHDAEDNRLSERALSPKRVDTVWVYPATSPESDVPGLFKAVFVG